MNDRHRAVMRARKEQLMYEHRKYEHKMDEFAKALCQSSRRPLPRLNSGLLPSSSGKQKARQMKGALWRP